LELGGKGNGAASPHSTGEKILSGGRKEYYDGKQKKEPNWEMIDLRHEPKQEIRRRELFRGKTLSRGRKETSS